MLGSAETTSRLRNRLVSFGLSITALAIVSALAGPAFNKALGGLRAQAATDSSLWPISMDYPEDGSIFPPGITPPTFLWRDALASSWTIDVTLPGGGAAIHVVSKGERMKLGPIDPDCVGETNEPPKLNPQQAASWTWTPDEATWKTIQTQSAGASAVLSIAGFNSAGARVSQAQISFTTSTDPVGSPIFYRDVPLMPSAGANGTVQPLSPASIHLIRWRLRDIRQPESRTLLTNMPTCANCHSFSLDGKTMGIDVDGPGNDKGLYALVPIAKHITIRNQDVIEWNKDGQPGVTRVGFMSQVSPDGKYVVSTFAPPSLDVPHTYYITNFKDYHFLQVFYPTRGILEWYDRESGEKHPLPGADDPAFVQTDGVWSPDGKWIVFARGQARDPYGAGQKAALHANDPNETQLQYNLYRIPFNNGRGGTPEPIAGASSNGMSNNFPKVSPDGKWIVFVQCHNGQLMRPDSQLYIVPFAGGEARKLRANTSLMNSWHSFSPNGRWLVFSSKARSPYTQMYLTHLDAEGNSSPAILIDNATASNRAVNIPEFMNVGDAEIDDIQVPAVEVYKLIDQAMHLEEDGKNADALAIWQKAESLDGTNAKVENGLGISLYIDGHTQEGFAHLRRSIQLNPMWVENHSVLGKFLLDQGQPEEAIGELNKAIELKPRFPRAQETLAGAYEALGEWREALDHWQKAMSLDGSRVSAKAGAAWLMATAPDASVRNGEQAVSLAKDAIGMSSSDDPNLMDVLAAAYAESGEFDRASSEIAHGISAADATRNKDLSAAMRARQQLYLKKKPFRESHSTKAAQTNQTSAKQGN
jgi:tetratricopeptide (TPR) repeat protein